MRDSSKDLVEFVIRLAFDHKGKSEVVVEGECALGVAHRSDAFFRLSNRIVVFSPGSEVEESINRPAIILVLIPVDSKFVLEETKSLSSSGSSHELLTHISENISLSFGSHTDSDLIFASIVENCRVLEES